MRHIDLRSDTVTKPSAGMREAMARAEVGDDVYGDDPTVNLLQERVAALLGKEAALFVPTGTMGNQLCLRAQLEPGDEVIQDAQGHVFNNESGATAALSGAQTRAVAGAQGIFTAEQLLEAIRPQAYWLPRSRVVVIENTHNGHGGTVWPLQAVRSVSEAARSRGLAVHMDGARLWNAQVASGVAAREFCAHVDTVSVCLSKGLGAPAGSVIAGDRALIQRAHRLRKMWGGGMRQVGVLAAAGLYALEHNLTRLAEDHANARALATALAAVPGIHVDLARVQTNIVYVTLAQHPADAVVKALQERGVLCNASNAHELRLVTHLDVDSAEITRAAAHLRQVVSG